MEKCLDFRTQGRLLVLRENARAPTDDDWKAFCAEIEKLRPRLKEMRALVFTDGGGPTADQRKKLATAISGGDIQTAVITDRPMVRFIVSTIGLFNKGIRTFQTREAPDAYAWLGLNTEDRQTIKSILRVLETTVSDLRSPADVATAS
jgi:hypothetical protein